MKFQVMASALALAAVVAIAPTVSARTWQVTPDVHSGTEASFTSKAAIVKFTGRTKKVDGFGEINVENPAKAPKAEVKVDLRTLDTGIDLRNTHMKGVIEAEKYPFATFNLQTLKARKLTANSPVQGVATGTFSLHGVSRHLTVPVTLTYLPQEDANYRPGDWVAASTEFKIKLSDYNIQLPKPVLGVKVSDELSIELDGMAKGI